MSKNAEYVPDVLLRLELLEECRDEIERLRQEVAAVRRELRRRGRRYPPTPIDGSGS